MLAAIGRRVGCPENARLLIKPVSNLLNPRNANGEFVPGITPASWIGSEGDAYEYLWNVPNNYPALFALLGGKSKVVPALRDVITVTP
jgi:putative alpha-1,2-mannosidase